MNILIVGSGALGQVFGLALARAGSSVHYLVKPAQAERTRAGFRLYQLRRFHPPAPKHLVPEAVLTDPSEAKNSVWDIVWLCVSSPALHNDTWLAQLRDSIGAATVVTFAQAIHDRATLKQYWPDEQIVQTAPLLLAYQAPLVGESFREPGTAYWTPPGATLALSGTATRVQPLVAALNQGGLRAKAGGAPGDGALVAAWNIPYMAALEAVGWSMDRFSTQLPLAGHAAREATTAVATRYGRRPANRLITHPIVAYLMFTMLTWLSPFNLERYFKYHFTKVGAQTRQMLDGWIEEARAKGLPRAHLEELRGLLTPR